jgi:hypothetical protein
VTTGHLDFLQTLVLKGAIPHVSPASDGARTVLFCSLAPLGQEADYNGNEQVSVEKLTVMIYEALEEGLDKKEKEFLLDIFMDAVVASAMKGAKDKTLQGVWCSRRKKIHKNIVELHLSVCEDCLQEDNK